MSILDEIIDLEDAGRDRLKVLVHGEVGTGKTTLASSLAEPAGKFKGLPGLYIDLLGEQGSDSIPNAARPNIRLVRPRSVEQLGELFWALQGNEVALKDGRPVRWVCIESVSALQQMHVRYTKGMPEDGPAKVERDNKGSRPKRQDLRHVYGDVVDDMKDFLTFWYSLADATAVNPLHVIMTSQSRFREVRRKTDDPNTQGEVIKEYTGPDVSPGSSNAVEAPPNFVLYTSVEERQEDLGAEPEERYCVRSRPAHNIVAKIHGDIDKAKDWPDVFGLGPKPQRLTLPKLAVYFGIPLT